MSSFVDELHQHGLRTVYTNAFKRARLTSREEIRNWLLARGNPRVRNVGLTGFVQTRRVYEKTVGEFLDISTGQSTKQIIYFF